MSQDTVAPGLSVQLYSLRDASAKNFDQVLSELATIGYQGVEPFNLFGKTPAAFRQQVEDLGMVVSSSHFPWANRSDISEVVDVLGAMGLQRAVGGFAPEDFADVDAVKRTAETCQSLIDALRSSGIQLVLHNHWWEFALLHGAPAYHQLQHLVPELGFEIDTYWAANFGECAPAVEIARVAERTPLIHVKDGPLVKGESHVAVGDGRMDISALFTAIDPAVCEWAIVELDACDSDMMTAIARSHSYLTRNQFVATPATQP